MSSTRLDTLTEATFTLNERLDGIEQIIFRLTVGMGFLIVGLILITASKDKNA